ncbi:Hypothetical protein A7982_02307 [Minicystis rosea]|nr:Hypothetical protein A7982_02307 [Minicystis rosea]
MGSDPAGFIEQSCTPHASTVTTATVEGRIAAARSRRAILAQR